MLPLNYFQSELSQVLLSLIVIIISNPFNPNFNITNMYDVKINKVIRCIRPVVVDSIPTWSSEIFSVVLSPVAKQPLFNAYLHIHTYILYCIAPPWGLLCHK